MALNRDPRVLGLIFAGGVAGTSLRAGLQAAFAQATWPWTTMCINVGGALALGLLLELLAGRGPDEGWRRNLRLTLGTGLLGSFTTYSALADEVVTAEPRWLGAAYGLTSVTLGIGAAAAGMWCGKRVQR